MVRKAMVVALFILLSVNGSQASGSDTRGQLPLQFETIFPHSPYTQVKRLCIQVWQNVLDMRSRQMPQAQAQWHQFNDRVIDSLLLLYTRIVSMVSRKKACSPDDIEHLMEVLNLIHHEYVATVQPFKNDEQICGAVLFIKIKDTLEKILE